MERLVQSKDNQKGGVKWAIDVEEGWTLYPVKTVDFDPDSKLAVHLGYHLEWMINVSTCALCCKGFAREDCFQLGTSRHKYHVTCLMCIAI